MLQYLNTAILTFIGTVSMIIFINQRDLKDELIRSNQEQVRIKVIQDHNTQQIDDIDARVKILEVNNMQEFKSWVDNNYLRKPQQ